MTLEFKVYVRELKVFLAKAKNQKVEEDIRWNDDLKRVTVPIAHLKGDELRQLERIIADRCEKFPQEKQTKDNRWTLGRIRQYFELREGKVDDQTIVKSVEALHVALKRFLEANTPHRWVFTESDDGVMQPYFVTGIEYTKRKRTRDDGVIPASVRLEARAYRQGTHRTINARWSEDVFTPMNITSALAVEDLVVETPKAVDSYLRSLEAYARYQSSCGLQVYAIGDAFAAGKDRWSSWGTSPMVRNGEPTRVVLDPLTEEMDQKDNKATRVYHTKFWSNVPDRNGLTTEKDADAVEEDDFGDETEAEPAVEVMLPLHPYLYSFDLDKHQWVNLHASNIQEYPWDKQLIDKLILPEDQKGLLNVLMSTTGENVGDIVRGKMSGIIVLATGVPGVGKTLTAEVFSEFIEKPLYSVQCSQLGLDVESIEGELQRILQRASRWGAVLLIDEADVYVRERGEDIQQNAIVGVFLRLLEYYRGVLFMTSNRDCIDDAILSRATAWIQYRLPDEVLLRRIWQVLGRQYKVKLTDADLDRLVKELPSLSGRSVRNILKLGVLLSGTKCTVDDLIKVSQYQALEKQVGKVVVGKVVGRGE